MEKKNEFKMWLWRFKESISDSQKSSVNIWKDVSIDVAIFTVFTALSVWSVTDKRMVEKMNSKEKMLEIIKKKQGGGKSKQVTTPKNDLRFMRRGPKIFNK